MADGDGVLDKTKSGSVVFDFVEQEIKVSNAINVKIIKN